MQLQGREHTASIFPEGTLSDEGSMLQEIFPRGLSLVEATCTGTGKKYEKEGTAKMKYFKLIATPPFLIQHCLLLAGSKVKEHTTSSENIQYVLDNQGIQPSQQGFVKGRFCLTDLNSMIG